MGLCHYYPTVRQQSCLTFNIYTSTVFSNVLLLLLCHVYRRTRALYFAIYLRCFLRYNCNSFTLILQFSVLLLTVQFASKSAGQMSRSISIKKVVIFICDISPFLGKMSLTYNHRHPVHQILR